MMISNARRVLTAVVVLALAGFTQTSGTANSSGTGKAVNPVAFSIKGLQLHMTAEEALPIMKQLAAENGAWLDSIPGLCVAEKIAELREHRDIDTQKTGKCVGKMQYHVSDRGKYELTLYFAEDLPKSPGTMRLWSIQFDQTGLETDADFRQFLSSVADKYGPATLATSQEIIYCSERGPGKTCRLEQWGVHYNELDYYDRTTDSTKLHCCPPVPRLGLVGFYARKMGRDTGVIDLYDVALVGQSAKEEARMIGETRTTGKPTL